MLEFPPNIVSILGTEQKTGKLYAEDNDEKAIEIDLKSISFSPISKMKLVTVLAGESFVKSNSYKRGDLHSKTEKAAFEINGITFSG